MTVNGDRVLSVERLHTYFYTLKGVVRAVNDVSFAVDRGRTLCLVGESGCGKSVAALSIMRLVASPPGRIVSGRVLFEGRDLLALGDEEMRMLRGSRISMIFQEPMTSLNPVFRVGRQIGEMFCYHEGLGKREARRKAIDLMALVGIPSPEKRVDDYPHQLSGGMRQRVMIAMALASPKPGLLIADEPTTALDVTIQAQILDLLRALQQRVGVSILLITHNMGVVAEMADDVVGAVRRPEGGIGPDQGTPLRALPSLFQGAAEFHPRQSQIPRRRPAGIHPRVGAQPHLPRRRVPVREPLSAGPGHMPGALPRGTGGIPHPFRLVPLRPGPGRRPLDEERDGHTA